MPAHRLIGVRETSDADERRGTPLVGRDDELGALTSALDEAAASRRARLVTIVGDAGVGKSRLTAEFLAIASRRALALGGRCLPYGDGITFWPIAEAVKAQAEIVGDDDAAEAASKLAALADPAGDGVTARLASALGLTVEPFPVEELFWAVRRLLAHLAADREVVLVVEDVHWAEPTLLALIEHLVQSVDAPVLILCPSRPELLEEAPAWSTGERASRIALEPLDADDAKSMIESVLGRGSLDTDVLERVFTASEGNPLFAEQLLRMLVDEGAVEEVDGTWRFTEELSEVQVPPTIQALLASRLDTLAGSERAVIEPASVVGYVFAEDAVAALAPPDVSGNVRTELTTLAQKHLVRPVEDGADGAHRFHHIMIRDTAYDGILKRARADLHTRFVAWADLANRDRGVEFEEILGYHLEQAWRYLSELGPLDDRGREIGEDAARRLASAGRRAFARGDIPGAASLLGRAAALLPSDYPERLRLLPEHGEALLLTGRYDEASAVLDEAIARPEEAPAVAARASLVRMLVGLRAGDSGSWRRESVDRTIDAARDVFAAEGDEAGLAMAYRLLAWSAGTACRFGDAADASALAVEHARRAGDARQAIRAATGFAGAALLGPTNVDEAIARCESSLDQAAGNRQSEGNLLAIMAGLYAMQGAFDHARELVGRGRALLAELGLDLDLARADMEAWRVEMLAGEVDAAEAALRRSYDVLVARGETYLRSTVAGLLGQTLFERGAPIAEVEALGDQSHELAAEDDVDSQAVWRRVRGRVLAQRGDLAGAEHIIREALELLEPTDAALFQLQAALDLGDVLVAADRADDARAAYEAARELAERKGGVVLLGAVLRRLEALDATPA